MPRWFRTAAALLLAAFVAAPAFAQTLTGSITGTIKDPAYRIDRGELAFERELHGLRNTVLLPAGWDVSAVSQSATLGLYQGRAFVVHCERLEYRLAHGFVVAHRYSCTRS